MSDAPATIAEAGAALRNGSLTSTALTRALLARTDALDETLGTVARAEHALRSLAEHEGCAAPVAGPGRVRAVGPRTRPWQARAGGGAERAVRPRGARG